MMEGIEPTTLADVVIAIRDGSFWICACVIVAGFIAS